MKMFSNDEIENDVNLNCKSNGPMFYTFYEFGLGYFESALINLRTLIKPYTKYNEEQRMIFPVMFCFLHGIELMLKSNILQCYEIDNKYSSNQTEKLEEELKACGHNLEKLKEKLTKKLKNYFSNKFIAKFIIEITIVLDKLKKINANSPIFRYPVDIKLDYNFFNKEENELKINHEMAWSMSTLFNGIVDILILFVILNQNLEKIIFSDIDVRNIKNYQFNLYEDRNLQKLKHTHSIKDIYQWFNKLTNIE